MTHSQYVKLNEARNAAVYSWLRWLMLISAGAFSLTAGLVLGKPYVGCQLMILKLALTANAIGILCGSIAVYGEAKLTIGFLRVFVDNEINRFQSKEYTTIEQLFYRLPWWVKYSEILFYSSLVLTVILWLAFIWLY